MKKLEGQESKNAAQATATWDSFARVFPPFPSTTCNYFKFWLVHRIASVVCDCLD